MRRKDHQCERTFLRTIIVIAGNGKQHEEIVELCDCEKEGATFVRYGLWPASPQHPKVGFQLSLLELQRVLLMEAHVSLYAFCKTLSHLDLAFTKVSSNK